MQYQLEVNRPTYKETKICYFIKKIAHGGDLSKWHIKFGGVFERL